jgi:hypothetical protein
MLLGVTVGVKQKRGHHMMQKGFGITVTHIFGWDTH